MLIKKITIFFNKLLPYLILFIFTSVVFYYSILLRKQWFGTLMLGDHHFLTGSTLKFTKNWVNEKPWNLYFAMLENPLSIEFNSLAERMPYVSYPPGAIIPIYLISIIFNKYPDTAMVMNFNLFNHFLISLTLGIIIFLLFRKYKINKTFSLLFSFIPITLEIFLPGPFYFLQNIYFSDQAVLLPYVLTIFLEILFDEKKGNMFIKIIQSFVILFGVFTDWFFYFLLLAIFLKRIFLDNKAFNIINRLINNIYLFILGFIPIIFLIWQVLKLNAVNSLIERFLVRTGISYTEDNTKSFLSTFWWSHFKINFGETGVFLYWLSFSLISLLIIITLRWRVSIIKLNKYLIYYLGILLLLPLIQVYIFKNHSLVHDFSTLKFSFTIATVPFALFPLLLINFSNQIKEKKLFYKIGNHLASFIVFISIIIWIFSKRYFSGKDLLLFQRSFFFSISIIGPLIILLNINKKVSIFLIFLSSLLLSISYLINSFPLIHKQFKDKRELPVEKIGYSISKCTKYNDIVFSFDLDIPDKPPVLISQSMKRVYFISSLDQIRSKIKNIKKPFLIKLFYLNKPDKMKYKFINLLGEYQCLGYYYSSFSEKQLNKIILNNSSY